MKNGKPRKDKPSGWTDTKVINQLARMNEARKAQRSQVLRERELEARLREETGLLKACAPIDAETRRRVKDARVRLSWTAEYW